MTCAFIERNDRSSSISAPAPTCAAPPVMLARPAEAPPDVTDELYRRARLQALGGLRDRFLLNLEQ